MTQKDKDLLLKVLSEQLPYGIKVWYPNGTGSIGLVKGIVEYTCYFETNPYYGNSCSIDNVKLYLRPMSSMTEEERDEFRSLGGVMSYSPQHDHWALCAFAPEGYDWLNKHHFDYRGLIPMGFAIEAPEGMYNF